MTRPSDATRSGGGSNPSSSAPSAPSSRQPLPGPPLGGPVGGPFRPPGPRFAPPPPPRRRLTGAQGSRLGLYALVIIVLGAAAGLAVTLLLPTQYAARTLIEYNVSVENASDFLRTDRNLTSQTVLLTSRAVLGPVADANNVSADDLAKRVSATLLNANSVNSEIIQVDVLSTDRATGVKLAGAIATQYLTVVKANSPANYIQTQLDDARRQLTSATAASQPALQTRIATLQGQLDTENITGNRASVVVPAYSVAAPAYPNPVLAAATGALCGIVVAGLVVIALSRRWTRS
jgi:capsular polysaccharide biosynthesis protein